MGDVNKLIADLRKQVCCIQKAIENGEAGGPAWFTSGNSDVEEDQFLGSRNEQDLVFKTFDEERARITKEGLFGINTSSPTSVLDVNGQITVRGGSPGIGKVLTSDANGLATWEVPSIFTLAARNGLSVDTGFAVLGQTLGDVGDPAKLLSHRQVPHNNFNIYWTGLGSQSFGYPDTSVVPYNTIDINGTLGVTQGTLDYPRFGLNQNLPARGYFVHGSATWGFAVVRPQANTAGANFVFYRTHGATANDRVGVPNGNTIGRMTFQAVAPDNVSVSTAASIEVAVGDTSFGVARGYFSFITADNSGFITTPRLTISANGNVTIGSGITTLGESDLSKLRVDNVLTGTQGYASLHVTPTWNTTGTPTAIKLNVTDTASNAASLLMDIQLGGVSRLKVSKTLTDIAGQIAIRGGSPGVGKVLTSDASGVATWETISGAVETLQQTMTAGNVTNVLYEFDKEIPATPGSPSGQIFMRVLPLDRAGGAPPLLFSLGATAYPDVVQRDNVFHFGWNINSGGGPEVIGEPGIGDSWELHFEPTPGDVIDAEKHEFYITRAGIQKRISSYTIRESLGSYDFYQTISRFYLKSPSDDRTYFLTQPASDGASLALRLSDTEGVVFNYDKDVGAVIGLNGTVTGGTRTFTLQDFDAAQFPTMQLGPSEIRVEDGITLRSENNNTTELGDSGRRWSTVWGGNGNFNNTLTATTIRSGGGGVDFSFALLNVSRHTNNGTVISIENTNAVGNGAYTQLLFDESIGGNKYADLIRYNTSAAGNVGATSIPLAGTVSLNGYNGTSNPSSPVMFTGSILYGIIGATGTNMGFRQDVVGLRIAQIQNLHTAGTSKLDIGGSSGYDQLRLRDTYTPTSSADANGNIGDTAWDDNYFYIKTSAGWKRSALSTF